MSNSFLQALRSGRVLLMDGAMGTELQRAGIGPGDCHEHWNRTNPERVLAVHRAYVDAGAEVLLTNTFQANPAALAKHQLEHALESIQQRGVRLARQASPGPHYVLGDIGPCDEHTTALAGMVRALAGTDGLLLETQSDLALFQQLEKTHPGTIPNPAAAVLVSFAYRHDSAGELRTVAGLAPEDVARQAAEHGADVVGVNCGRDINMDDVIEIIRRYRTVTDLPLLARPNAGTPINVDGQWVYPHSPEQLAAKLPRLLDSGVAMVGGCCGTTPAHIAAFRQVIDSRQKAKGKRKTSGWFSSFLFTSSSGLIYSVISRL